MTIARVSLSVFKYVCKFQYFEYRAPTALEYLTNHRLALLLWAVLFAWVLCAVLVLVRLCGWPDRICSVPEESITLEKMHERVAGEVLQHKKHAFLLICPTNLRCHVRR